MFNNALFPDEMSISQCATCRLCCSDIPTCIIDYHTLHFLALKSKNANFEKLLNEIVLYRIKPEFLNSAAYLWQHYFKYNLLEMITIPNDVGDFLIAAIPKTRGKCPFLSEIGCILRENKPLNCKLFPYIQFQGRISISPVCPLQKKSISEITLNKLDEILEEYTQTAIHHSLDYYELLKRMNSKFNWRIINYKSL
ncbi:MAG: YkgJ family cysteine cluster protein [Candidatus Lokiarchaeota archaeon]|nr:YkgJ family cysteine cluster protein [Candidatus Harpocratesius repetitus]